MIETFDDALKIQQRRIEQGKRGYAKAVRRFLSRKYNGDYSEMRAELPAIWSPDDLVIQNDEIEEVNGNVREDTGRLE